MSGGGLGSLSGPGDALYDAVEDYSAHWLGSVPNDSFIELYKKYRDEVLIPNHYKPDDIVRVGTDENNFKYFKDFTPEEKAELFDFARKTIDGFFPPEDFTKVPITEQQFFINALAWDIEKSGIKADPSSEEFKQAVEKRFLELVKEPIASTPYEIDSFIKLNKELSQLEQDLASVRGKSEGAVQTLEDKREHDISYSLYSKLAMYMTVPDGEFKSIDQESASAVGAVFRDILLGKTDMLSEMHMSWLTSSMSSPEEKVEVLKALSNMEGIATNSEVKDALHEVSDIVSDINVPNKGPSPIQNNR